MEQGPSHRVSEVKRALKVISSLSLAVLESLSLSSLAARSTASPSLDSAGHPESSCPGSQLRCSQVLSWFWL